MSAQTWLGWLAFACCSACAPAALEPEGHILVTLTTDAPLPAPPGAPEPEAVPLFDRLRIDLFAPGDVEPCAGCSRELAVDSELLDPASFAVTSEPGEGPIRMRVRLYRSGGTASGEPRRASTIETIASLPAILDEGGIERHLVLSTENVGVPQGSLDQPIETTPGRAPTGLVGRFGREARTLCNGTAPQGSVCVGGGAFWMGNPRLDLAATPELDGALEHLVVLSSFWLDAREVSVAEFRASGLAKPLVSGGPSDDPHESGTGIAHCSYTTEPGQNDALPVNCLTWSRASAYCASFGKRLPTEAELEYAGSARGRFPYVWGTERAQCGDAVFERDDTTDVCAVGGTGPLPAGSGARDRLELPGAPEPIVDLAANVREWTLDLWNRQDEPCWAAPVLRDPRCEAESPGDGSARATRGGHFGDVAQLLQASVRSWLANETQAVSALIGVRCAAGAEPAATDP